MSDDPVIRLLNDFVNTAQEAQELAHRYHLIDYEIVWKALADRLPVDGAAVARIPARRRDEA